MAKILIVEDAPEVVGYMTTILHSAGYACVTAESAAQARELLDANPDISLVLLDHNLGGETGLDLLTAWRELPKLAEIPVIVCSGDTRPLVVGGFLGQRIAGFIKKPFRPERLLADIERVLGRPGDTLAPWAPLGL